MKLTFLSEGAATGRLLLIAAGWNTTARFYEGVSMPGWDTAVVTQDGSDANAAGIVAQTSGYKTIYLYAWSLGVAMSEVLYDAGLRPTASFAVGGTSMPDSDSEGIPVAIFETTRAKLDPRILAKFRRRMCGGASAYRQIAEKFERGGHDDIAALQDELSLAAGKSVAESLPWTKAFICAEDAVFPAENQRCHWQRRGVSARSLSSPHYVDLQSIVDATVVNLPRAGRRFARSASSYSSHAMAQREIAQRLASDVSEAFPDGKVGKMLELGCGSGELSRALGEKLHISEATFVDLYPCEPFGVADEEEYLTGDAELLVEKLEEGCYDLICSSSAIQWFSDTRRFLHNCSRLLSSGGVLALSTFAEGNLAELDALRESSIGYLSDRQLMQMATDYFDDVAIGSDVIRLCFPTPGELMRHLKLTGVTAAASKSMSPGELREFIKRLPRDEKGDYTLTFKPVYIIARCSRKSPR